MSPEGVSAVVVKYEPEYENIVVKHKEKDNASKSERENDQSNYSLTPQGTAYGRDTSSDYPSGDKNEYSLTQCAAYGNSTANGRDTLSDFLSDDKIEYSFSQCAAYDNSAFSAHQEEECYDYIIQ